MKHIDKLFVAAIAVSSVACTNLDEKLYSYISQDNYGTTTEEMNSLIGPAYGTMANYIDGYFWYGMCAGDDYIIPSRGYDWNSGGIYRHTHEHIFTAEEANDVYNFWHFSDVTTINKIMNLVENTTVEIPDRERVVAELRGLRAWWYFYMMDKMGPIPIVTKFDDSIPTNKGVTRKDVYDFIESELLDIIPSLNEEVTVATYAKFTKWVAYTLLAKLRINAEVYTGTPDWKGTEEALDAVVGSGKYILEPDNNTNFLVNNEGSRENIFVIPYDNEHFKCYFIPYQMSWHYNVQETMGVRFGCWNGPCFTPSFMKSYNQDDKRLGWFMYGPQYAKDGTPLQDRNGNPLDITIEMKDYANATEVEGARILKWEVEENGYNHLDNDFAVFRYVDVLLMKAECLLRTGKTQEATDLVNECRKRNFDNYDESKSIKTLTLDELLAERGRELVVEGWRRNDLIRFGKFMGTFDFKTTVDDSDGHTLLFPIPQSVIDNNDQIVQNSPRY